MRGKWGIIRLAALIVAISLIGLPLAVEAAGTGSMSSLQLSSQTPMEAQMLGEKPFQAQRPAANSAASLLSGSTPGLQLGQDGAALKLPFNLEMQISVRYNREPGALEPQKRGESLLMNSSLDYRLLPNFKVGLNAYLYRPDPDSLSLYNKPLGDRFMGLGPSLKYDLGRWSFLLKSQLETGSRERGSDLQNTVRVWYAF